MVRFSESLMRREIEKGEKWVHVPRVVVANLLAGPGASGLAGYWLRAVPRVPHQGVGRGTLHRERDGFDEGRARQRREVRRGHLQWGTKGV